MSVAEKAPSVTLGPVTNASTDLSAFYDEQVRPRLNVDAVFTDPAHNFKRSSGKLRGGCPGHVSASGSSFNVTVDTLAWYCPACDAGGGPIQYRHWLKGGSGSPRGRDFIEVLRELAGIAGVPFPERELTTQERETAEARVRKRGILDTISQHCQVVLWSDAGTPARDYLRSRGLTDVAIMDQGLGLYPDLPEIRKVLKSAGYDKVQSQDGAWEKLVGYIVVPWADEYGQPMTLYGRWPGKQPPDDTRTKRLALAKTMALPGEGTKASPLFFDRVRKAHQKETVLVEGLLDAMLGRALGDDRLVAYVGAQPSFAQHKALARHGIRAATICSDPDKGGESGILSFIKNADPSIRTYVAPKLPDGLDPDEFMLAHGIDGWREHIARAVPGFIWRTRHILDRHDLASAKGRDDARAGLADYASTLAEHQLDEIADAAAESLAMQASTLRHYLAGIPEQAAAAPQATTSVTASVPTVVPSPNVAPREGRGRLIALPTSPALNKISRPGHRPQTDLGNSERVTDKFGGDLRYCGPFGSYLVWDGKHWRPDQTGAAVTLAKRVVRDIYLEAAKAETADERSDLAGWARKSEAAARIEAMLRLAQSSVPIETDDLDRDPWLLNVANGTVDLRTGELRPHRREDFITKLIDVEYRPDAPCGRWARFLEEIQPEGATRQFLQRGAGYSATGAARERVLLILHGGGRNGKSVFLQELRTTLGPYAVRMPSETFLAKRQDGAIPNDIAQLRGARLAFGSETGEGRRLAEAKIKELTGDESISARFMRGEWFDFRPTFTPWLATNHRPVIKGSDAAIWDRIRLVPFNVRFRLPDEPDDGSLVADLTLSEKLDAERAGILAWIIRGAIDWYQNGLGTTDKVRSATAGYRTEMDDLADFLADRCVAESQSFVGSRTLYEVFKAWSEGSGERPLSEKMFSTRIEERGFSKKRTKAGVQFSGVRIRTPLDDSTPGVGLERCRVDVGFSGIAGNVQKSHVETPEKATPPYTLHPLTVTNADERPCWSCRQVLDPISSNQCPECGWLLCPCGACGCREDDDA